MAIKKTPPLLTKGRYTVAAPFTVNPTSIYTCVAIRSFSDIYQLGYDVYKTYYEPMGLVNGTVVGSTTFDFNVERNKQPNIITLRSEEGTFLYVPDTYITSFPDMGDILYNHMVLSVSLGALPDYLDLSSLKAAIQSIVAQHFGVASSVVSEHRTPSTNNPTRTQHEVLETARLAAITLLETDHAKALRLQVQNTLLQNKINALTAILDNNGLLP